MAQPHTPATMPKGEPHAHSLARMQGNTLQHFLLMKKLHLKNLGGGVQDALKIGVALALVFLYLYAEKLWFLHRSGLDLSKLCVQLLV